MDQAIVAELSSIEYAISDLASRLARLGDRLELEKNDRAATEMYQAEKSLVGAARRLAKAQKS